MGKWKHRLSNVDELNMVADCAECGEQVPVYFGGSDRLRCWTGRQRGGNYGSVKLTYGQKQDLFYSEVDRVCKVCQKRLTYNSAVLDHCHDSDRLRNFLCNRCNLMIGMARDNSKLLENAAKYLKEEGSWLDGK